MQAALATVLAALAAASPIAAQDEGRERHRALVDEYVEASKTYLKNTRAVYASDEFKELRAAGKHAQARKLLAAHRPPGDDFGPKFAELAQAHEGKALEADCLLWIVMNTRGDPITGSEAVEGLLARHIDSDAVRVLALNWFRLLPFTGGRTAKVFERISENSKNSQAVAEALWARMRLTRGQKRIHAKLAARIREVAPDSAAALRLDADTFKKERLQIGMVAPDIAGEDIDGKAFKLSDYRGKVVVLDFWGDW